MKGLRYPARALIAGAAVVAIALGAAIALSSGRFASSADNEPPPTEHPSATTEPSPAPWPQGPPPYNRWIRPDTGEFWVDVYDDRHISEDDRASDPVYNPRWDPFAACIENEGYESLALGSSFFTQADMDALLARVNAERPDASANRQVNNGDTLPGLAGAFLKCADEWLALTPEEAKALGFEEGKRSNYRPQ